MELSKGKIIAIVVACVVLFTIIIGLCMATATIDTGHTGVIKVFGKVQDTELTEGWHLKDIFGDVIVVDNRIKKATVKVSTSSSDLQTITGEISVNYNINKTKSSDLVKTVGTTEDAVNTLLMPRLNEAIKSATSKYTAEEIIKKREEAATKIKDALVATLKEQGFNIIKVNAETLSPSKAYLDAIEKKAIEIQNKQRVDNEVQTELALVEKAKAEKERMLEQSRGYTDQYLANKWIEAWKAGGSQVPSVVTDGSNFMLNLENLDKNMVNNIKKEAEKTETKKVEVGR